VAKEAERNVKGRASPATALRAGAAKPHVRLGAVVALAALAALVAWLIVRTDDGSKSRDDQNTAATVSADGLKTLAASLGTPLFWAGPEAGKRYEVTRTPEGNAYVCYVPGGETRCLGKAFLTIGTYPLKDALAVITSKASESGSVSLPAPGGGAAFYTRKRPQSIYLATPGLDYEVEIYDPSPARARRVLASDRVAPVPSVQVLDAEGLRTLAGALGRPVYWAGPEADRRYELTQARDGRTYVCYLPPGETGCSVKPFLTVGTYPVQNALSVTRAASLRPGSVPVEVGGGGVAFYARSRPTSVYVAFPGEPFQIEVYDPEAGRARALVSSGRIATVR
jgi:hypothetical protein